MNSQQFIDQFEHEADRDDIVDLHGKDAYYINTGKKRGFRSRPLSPASREFKKWMKEEKEKIQREREEREALQQRESENQFSKLTTVAASLTATTINAFTDLPVPDSWEDVMDTELESKKICQICQEDREDFVDKVALPCCGHEYHMECVQGIEEHEVRFVAGGKGGKYQKRVNCRTCPNCRGDFRLPTPQPY
jgi:hypothetical protein